MLFPDLSLETVTKMLKDLKDENIIKDKKNTEFKLDFYEGRGSQEKYFEDYGLFDKRGKPLVPLVHYNITRKVIDKLSLIYKKRPEIRMEKTKKNDPYVEWMQENDEIHGYKKDAERFKNLVGVVLFAPLYFWREWEMFNEKQTVNEWRFFVEPDFIPHFHEDDPLHAIAYSIPIKSDPYNTDYTNIENQRWMFWSNNYYFEHDTSGDSWEVDETDYKNPFGINPYVELRESLPVTKYNGDFAFDLVKANQSINVNMANLNLMIKHQAHDQLYVTGIDKDAAGNIEVGPNKILWAPEGANIGLAGYNPKIIETFETIKSQIHTIAWTYNVSIDWNIEGTVASGVALKIKNMDLLEAREDDIDLAKSAERKIYKVIQAQHEYYKKIGKLDSKIKLTDEPIYINFAEIDFPANVEEELRRKEFDLQHNVISEVDLIKERDPDLDDKQAEERLIKNKSLNQQSARAFRFQQAAEEGTNEE